MKEELGSLEKSKAWALTKLAEEKKVLQNKWVYRVKEKVDGSKRYKARLVVKGFFCKRRVLPTWMFFH